MGKKLKRNANNKKKTPTRLDEGNISKNKKHVVKAQNNNKPVKVKDQSVKFKSKHKKNTLNLKQTLKKLRKDEGSHSSLNFLNSNIANVTSIGKKNEYREVKDKKVKFQHQNEEKQNKFQKSPKNKKQRHSGSQSFKQINMKKNKVTALGKHVQSSVLPNSKEISIGKRKKTKKQKQIEANNKTEKVKSLISKETIEKEKESPVSLAEKSGNSKMTLRHCNLNLKKLEGILAAKQTQVKPKKEITKMNPLRERMMSKLKASRFRYLNETMYSSESLESKKYFKDDPDSFTAYHEGYKQQVAQWPVNPLDVIISSIKKMPKDYIIADFGCGEARLSASVPQKVHSFDFVSLNENVTACDMAHTPLLASSVQVVVFCLSLMGTNLKDYIIEANRILKQDGILKIAEVESRFDRVEDFIKVLADYGFQNTLKDLSHNLFYFLDFKKKGEIGRKRSNLTPITLKPCLYKKR
ncbi:ribosomal RNA-processing protein 8 [Augochlora pura]